MSDLQDLVRRYLATWNTLDPAARREALGELWAEDGTYTDPLVEAVGVDQIDAVIAGAQSQFPGLVFRLAEERGIDAHHNLARFTWELGPAGGPALAIGFDVAVAGPDGRLRAVHGFLDQVPSGA